VEHAHGLAIPRTLEEARDAGALALIVYDMQAGIVDQLPDGSRITARVGEVLRVARSAGLRIFFTRHLSLPVEVAGVAALRTAMTWQRSQSPGQVVAPFPRDSPQSQIVAELAPPAQRGDLR
jgi:biuret amidohydrolase